MDPDPWLVRLNSVASMGPLVRTRLLERYGSARAVLESSAAMLARVPGVTPALAAKTLESATGFDVDEEVARCEELGIRLVARGEDGWPEALRFLPDPPPILYVRGGPIQADAPAVAVIGARRCSSYGRRQARRFAMGLGRSGVDVVSGLARGVDSAAHRGALEAGGRTVAVLGSGLDRIYPPEHAGLAEAIVDGGCLVSEFPLGTPPLRHHFPRRNRVLAGLSFGVVVVEAARRSGSLITALLALDGGREVFAVPGPVDSDLSSGTHRLLREGARLVESPDEILEDLGLSAAAEERPPIPDDPHSRRVLEAIPLDRGVLVDELVQDLSLPAGSVLAALARLSLDRHVVEEDGGRWVRAT